tara:strand:+ start:2298 stop:2762 length:465 start_codon:yes stop_codon:yes gene_type:complete
MSDIVKSDLLPVVQSKDVVDYWLRSAMATEQMLAQVMSECSDDPIELSRRLKAVQTYVSVRKSIGDMVEKASVDDGGSWDPFADNLDNRLDNLEAKSDFIDRTSAPQLESAVELYKSGMSYNEIIDKTGLSRRRVEKAVRQSGHQRKRDKKVAV